MKDSRNEQLIAERQRAANFIIYRIKETSGSEESKKENNGIILGLFLERISMSIQPGTYIRLGKSNSNITRSLKRVMPSTLGIAKMNEITPDGYTLFSKPRGKVR